FFRITAEINPRTLCGCQPRADVAWSMVIPPLRRMSATSREHLVRAVSVLDTFAAWTLPALRREVLGLLRCGLVGSATLSCCCAGHLVFGDLVFMDAMLANAVMGGSNSDALVQPQVQSGSGWRLAIR